MDQPERLLTVKQVAERFGVTVPTVRRWIAEGRLSGWMPGGQKAGYRIPSSAVERMARGEAQPATPPVLRPSRSAIAERPLGPSLNQALQQVERCRRADDLDGAARWEKIAAQIAANLASERTSVE